MNQTTQQPLYTELKFLADLDGEGFMLIPHESAVGDEVLLFFWVRDV